MVLGVLGRRISGCAAGQAYRLTAGGHRTIDTLTDIWHVSGMRTRLYAHHVAEDDGLARRGRWAYSAGAVAAAAGVSAGGLATDRRRGRVDLGSLSSVARYVARALLAVEAPDR